MKENQRGGAEGATAFVNYGASKRNAEKNPKRNMIAPRGEGLKPDFIKTWATNFPGGIREKSDSTGQARINTNNR